MNDRLVFISQNPYKYEELQPLFHEKGITLTYISEGIREIQSDDLEEIIKDKILKAFKMVGRPVIVEHTWLFINSWNGMPGGLTQLLWDKLQGEKICKMVGLSGNRGATAKTIVGFCDGKKIYYEKFIGTLKGTISEHPRGAREVQWGTIFVPEGHNKTYSELTIDEVNTISHRSRAFEKFFAFYLGQRND